MAAVVALAVTVTPSLAKKAESFLTAKKAAATYVSNKKASTLFLRKKSAANLYVAKADAPQPSVVGIAAGTAVFGPISSPTAGYIPTAFTSFATPAKFSSAVITFSGNATCTAPKPGADQACPVSILVDGQVAGKFNLVPSTAATPTPVPIVGTATLTTVLAKGGHTVSVQYAGAKNVSFTLKGWSLAVQATPQPEEAAPVETTTKGS